VSILVETEKLRKGGGSLDSPEMRRKQLRKIYEHLRDKPRFRPHHVSKEMGLRPSSVAARLKEAVEKGYIVGPQIRKKSFSNFKTFVYLASCGNPIRAFKEYMINEDIIYHEMMDGSFNLYIISRKELDIEGMVLGGVPSDYYVSYPPDQSWEISIHNMRDMVRKFNPDNYTPKGYIKTHWDETIEWRKEDEILFWEFKYNLRKPLQPLSEKTGIGIEGIRTFLERLPQYCTVLTCYFSLTVNAYDPHIYLIETDYEDFIIDLLSQLPVTCWFQKVSDTLIAHLWILRKPTKRVTTHAEDIPELQIPLLVDALVEKGIVKRWSDSKIRSYWRKEVYD
jgi:hypothetical protein